MTNATEDWTKLEPIWAVPCGWELTWRTQLSSSWGCNDAPSTQNGGLDECSLFFNSSFSLEKFCFHVYACLHVCLWNICVHDAPRGQGEPYLLELGLQMVVSSLLQEPSLLPCRVPFKYKSRASQQYFTTLVEQRKKVHVRIRIWSPHRPNQVLVVSVVPKRRKYLRWENVPYKCQNLRCILANTRCILTIC